MDHPLKVVGACERCVKRSARYTVPVESTDTELCEMCLRSTNPRPRGVKSIYAGVPPVDVREAFTMSDDVAARVDKLRNAPRISAIVLYEVTDDGGALLHLQSAGVRDSGLDLTLFPDGTTDLGI